MQQGDDARVYGRRGGENGAGGSVFFGRAESGKGGAENELENEAGVVQCGDEEE